MEKVTVKRFRRRNGIVVSETITETTKFDKHDDRDKFKAGVFMLAIVMTIVVTALAVVIVEALY